MKQIPFYEEYLKAVVLPKMMETVRSNKDISSLARYRKAFNDQWGYKISYEVFRQWMKDGGISLARTSEIRVAGQPAAPTGGSLPQSKDFPDVAPPENVNPVNYDRSAGQRVPQQGGPNLQYAGRGGVDMEQLFGQ